MTPGERALAWALEQLGRGETTGQNDGPFVEMLLGEKARLSWCAAFVLRAFEHAGAKLPGNFFLNRQVKALEQSLRKARFLLPDSEPIQPGDIVTFDREGGSGHVGIVAEVRFPEAYVSIEGNVGNRVTRVWHTPTDHRAAFRVTEEVAGG